MNYSLLVSPNAQFVTNQSGEKTSVILPIAEYEALLEDLEDLAVVAERAEEPTIPLDQVVANLKKDGFLDN
ncbi:MAG TPA: hypothetical protein VHY09_16065 [Candidatus Methylacidiphilales bacterium]|nr:hypothetical protein [Candidatus Methylacidiphilales bacterium]